MGTLMIFEAATMERCKGGATFAPGLVSEAFSFDGIDGYVSVPDDPVWDFGASEFTIDLWFNFNVVGDRNPFVAHNDGSGPQNKWFFEFMNGDLNFHINS